MHDERMLPHTLRGGQGRNSTVRSGTLHPWPDSTDVSTNHADASHPPPTRVERAARRRSMRTWTHQQLREFLTATEGDELHPVWVVATTTGLRRSELLGLRWRDVDLQAATVTIQQTVLVQEGGAAPSRGQRSQNPALRWEDAPSRGGDSNP